MRAQDRYVSDWFHMIRLGQLQLPTFQRHEAWYPDQVTSLIDTLLQDLPIGATLALAVGKNPPFVARRLAGTPEPVEDPIEQLLDGQQRLTALWRALHDGYENTTYFVRLDEPPAEEDGGRASRVVRVGRWLKPDGTRMPLWPDEPAQVLERDLIPARLLRPFDIAAEIDQWLDAATGGVEVELQQHRLRSALDKKITHLRTQIQRYNIPVLKLDIATPPEVALDVFLKINTSGTPLTVYDIIVAQFQAHTGKSLHELVRALLDEVPELARFGEPEHLILQAAALRANRPPTQRSALMLSMKDLDEKWSGIVAGARWMVEMLAAEHVFDDRRLPTVAVLPVLVALHAHLPAHLDARGNALTLVRSYLWRAFCTDRYAAAAGTRQLQDYRGLVSAMTGHSGETAPILDDASYPAPEPEKLGNTAWPTRKDTLARAILAVSLKAGAIDIAENEPVSASSLAQREYHHLFPDSLLTQDGGIDPRYSSQALNCALIKVATNRSVSAKEPLKYLRERIESSHLGEEAIRHRLKTHAIPFEALNIGGWSEIEDARLRAEAIHRDYSAFLTARAEMVAAAMRSLCVGLDWPKQEVSDSP